MPTTEKPATEKPTPVQKGLIDNIDFTNVIAKAQNANRSLVSYWSDAFHTEFEEYRRDPGLQYFDGIQYPLIFAYLCKYHVETVKDIHDFVLRWFGTFSNYLSDENLRNVFRLFNTRKLVEIMNAMETEPDVFNAFFKDPYAADKFNQIMLKLSDRQLDLFLQETGADKFVNYIKGRRVAERERIVAEKKKEEEERKKAAEEAEKQRQQAEKEDAAKQKALEEYRKKISQRLKKLAYNLDSLGVWKYSMKLPWYRNPISKEDISGLSPDDPGVKNMFGALVRAQKHVNTPERLAYFNNMLELMSGQFDPKKCLQHVTVADMMAAAGVENFDVAEYEHPGYKREQILQYRKALEAVQKYQYIFQNVYGLKPEKYPHDLHYSGSTVGISIYKYNSAEEFNALVEQRTRDWEIKCAVSDVKSTFDPKVEKIDRKLRNTWRVRLLKRAVLNSRRAILEKRQELAENRAIARVKKSYSK